MKKGTDKVRPDEALEKCTLEMETNSHVCPAPIRVRPTPISVRPQPLRPSPFDFESLHLPSLHEISLQEK